MHDDLLPLPEDLLDSSGSFQDVAPPVQPRQQSLPYDQITWKYFERLCARILTKDSELRSVRPYGEQGDAQQGIDIYAYRSTSKKFTVCQCKNVETFGPAAIAAAVSEFAADEWAGRSDRFIIAVRDTTTTAARDKAIAQAVTDLDTKGIEFEHWDGKGLDVKLKQHADVVADFFGPAWAEAFNGVIVPAAYPNGEIGGSPEERGRVRKLIEGLTR